MLNLINTALYGVLIRAERGTAKSTAGCGLTDLIDASYYKVDALKADQSLTIMKSCSILAGLYGCEKIHEEGKRCMF